jgi:predicted nucleic acid-binding protein
MRVLHTNLQFLAPDLILAEVGNILWKKCRRNELTINIASAILNDFKKFPIHIHSSELLLDTSWQIATQYQRSLYDSLYVALAQIEECPLITADKALYNALRKTPLAQTVLWVEDRL